MADLIDRAALLKAGDVTKMDVAFEDWNRLDNATKRHIVNYGKAVRRLVEAAPAVDAVEVVRCKDCEHFKLFSDGYTKCKHRYGLAQITLDSFCSRGERKEK